MSDQVEAAAETLSALGAEPGASSDVVNSEAAQAAESADDAWLEENLLPDTDEELAGEPQPAAGDDAPQAGDDTDDSEQAVEQAQGADTEQLEVPDIDPAEYADALTAVMRAGLTMEDAKALPPERVMAIAEHQAKIQSDLDRRFREGGSSGDATDNGDPEGNAQQAEAPSGSPPDIEQLASPPQELVDALALDGEGTKLLADWQKQAAQPLMEQNQALHGALQQLQQQVVGMQAENARAQLQEQFPQLADTTTPEFQRFVQRVDKLDHTGQYTDVRQLMEDAASIEFAADKRAEVTAAQDRINRLKDSGQPTPPSGKDPRDEQRADQGDIDDQILIALDEGNHAEVKRLQRLQGL